jgi:hypothetical protein
VPEVVHEVVPEKKVPAAPPKKPEAPPVTGILPLSLFFRRTISPALRSTFAD